METNEAATPLEAPATEAALHAEIMSKLDAPETASPPAEGEPQATEPNDGDAVDSAPVAEGESAEPADKPEGQEAAETLDLTKPVKVKVNGQELEVPLEEALKGYSRLEDYKAKTAELAEHRRTVESQYAERLQQATELFIATDPVLAAAQTIDWNALAQEDPGQYVQLKAAVEQRQQSLGAAQAELDRIKQAREAETYERENAALLAAIPQLADPAERTAFETRLQTYLGSQGLPAEALEDVVFNHKLLILADKARQFDELQQAAATLPAKKVEAKPAAKPMKPTAPEAAPRPTPKRPGPASSDDARRAWVLAQLDAE